MKTRLIACLRMRAALVAALIAFCVVDAEGTDSFGLPQRLSIGSVTALNEGSVTGQLWSIANILYYTNKSGLQRNPNSSNAKQFASYAGYKSYMVSNAFALFNQYKSDMDTGKVVRLVSNVGYLEQTYLNTFDSLLLNTNVGIASTITSNSFYAAFQPQNKCLIVPVVGLQKFVVKIEGYQGEWPVPSGRPQNNIVPPPPDERTTNNVVILNPWYSTGTNEVRIGITVNNRTRWYTQFGDPVDVSPTQRIISDRINSTFARGARFTFDCSTDLVNWTSVTNFSDLGGTGFISIPITKDRPRAFFRVGIQ